MVWHELTDPSRFISAKSLSRCSRIQNTSKYYLVRYSVFSDELRNSFWVIALHRRFLVTGRGCRVNSLIAIT